MNYIELLQNAERELHQAETSIVSFRRTSFQLRELIKKLRPLAEAQLREKGPGRPSNAKKASSFQSRDDTSGGERRN